MKKIVTDKKPLMLGLDLVRGAEWKPKLFSMSGAHRFMEQQARKSSLHGAVAFVADCGEYWRGSIGAKY